MGHPSASFRLYNPANRNSSARKGGPPAQGTELPANVRGELALAGWTRAVILHDYESAKTFAGLTIQLRPETKAPLQPFG